MAFPQVASTTETQFTAVTTAHAVDLPATVNDGDLLFLQFSSRNFASTFTGPSGWTVLWEHTPVPGTGGTTTQYAAYLLVADGTEGGGSADVVTSVATAAAAHVLRITDWFGDLAGVEIGTIAGGSDDKPDPPSLTPSWGAEDTLWIAVFGAEDDEAIVSIWPTNFDDNQVDTVSGLAGGQGATVGSSTREINTTVQNPSAYDLNKTEFWGAQTIAVRENVPVALTLVKGTLTITGKTLAAELNVALVKGSLALVGKTLLREVDHPLSLVKGDLTLIGKTLSQSTELDLIKGDLTLTGKSLEMRRSGFLMLVKGDLTLTGKSLSIGLNLGLAKGDLILTGKVLAIDAPKDFVLVKGALTVSGKFILGITAPTNFAHPWGPVAKVTGIWTEVDPATDEDFWRGNA